jgi:tRNA(fMet)-specific endonuclease VapC
MIVLDSDIVTLITYGRTENLQRRLAAVPAGEDISVTVITRMEILRGRYDGIVKAADPEELLAAMARFRSSRDLLDSFRLLDVDDTAAKQFGDLLKAKKKPKRRGDLLIACVALAQDALLVTRNVKDYKDVPKLRVENWAD